MAIAWLWTPNSKPETAPAVSDQYIAMGRQVLCLRNPWPADSAFMGKMYSTTIFSWVIYFIYYLYDDLIKINTDSIIAISLVCFPVLFLFLPSLAYRINFISRQSNFYFNRITQKVYYRKGKLLHVGEWSRVQAGMLGQTEYSGRSFSTSYSLLLNVFGTEPSSEQARLIAKSWAPNYNIAIDSNEPSDPRTIFVAQVWEYIRQFMAHGPDNLPLPHAPHWWNVPHNNLCLTPAQSWRHYAPWRTGEPGEAQVKKWWLLPFWAALFPYNLFAALCWWATCRLFKVRPATPPPEAFEGETGPLVTIEMAARGIRP
ncbi:hypothetical protein AB4Z48_25020 [Cupriavidus sp. 2TAF22]|uniref:hypothetical protein n=1 Tax=unclassified Cupriavidus TaxID=2640874 RepID=UPI003F9043F1